MSIVNSAESLDFESAIDVEVDDETQGRVPSGVWGVASLQDVDLAAIVAIAHHRDLIGRPKRGARTAL